MFSPTARRSSSLSRRMRRMLISGLKRRLLIGGLLVRCQVLGNLSLRATPSNIDDHVAEVVTLRNRGPISLPDLTTRARRPRDQRSQRVTWRRAIHHGPPTTAPLVHTTVLLSPCNLDIQMFSRGGEGLEQSQQFSFPLPPPTTGQGIGRGQKAEARRAPHTTLHQFTSLAKRTMKSDVLKPPNQRDLSRRPREEIVSDCSQLVQVLELP